MMTALTPVETRSIIERWAAFLDRYPDDHMETGKLLDAALKDVTVRDCVQVDVSKHKRALQLERVRQLMRMIVEPDKDDGETIHIYTSIHIVENHGDLHYYTRTRPATENAEESSIVLKQAWTEIRWWGQRYKLFIQQGGDSQLKHILDMVRRHSP